MLVDSSGLHYDEDEGDHILQKIVLEVYLPNLPAVVDGLPHFSLILSQAEYQYPHYKYPNSQNVYHQQGRQLLKDQLEGTFPREYHQNSNENELKSRYPFALATETCT